MSKVLAGKRVAFLATDGFEQAELTQPWNSIKDAGAVVVLVSPKSGLIQGMSHDVKADEFTVDETVDSVSAEDFDGLVLLGGVVYPETLRVCEAGVSFVRDFFKQHKPVAAICHGPWALIEADVVRGRRVTSWPSWKTDLINAGGEWVDEECVVDQGLVTGRKPDDLDAYCAMVIEVFAV